MGYNIGRKSEQLVLTSEYLGGSVDEAKHFAKDKFTLTDKYGNEIYYELQSAKQGKKDTSLGGYLIAQTNIECGNKEKLLNSARQYFNEHPDQRITTSNSAASVISDYSKILIGEAAADCIRNKDNRKATTLEKGFLFQYSYLEQINKNNEDVTFLSWEQVTGKQDFGDDHIELSRESIKQDKAGRGFKEKAVFGDEWNKSADKGEKSLLKRMKQDSKKAKMVVRDRGDGQKSIAVESSVPETFDEDEKNALIRYAVKRKYYLEQ